MKELLIEQKSMDYEKKYKELVGKIEKAYLYAQTDSTKAVLEEIRPELNESEDEKIRKWIIAQLELKSDIKNPRDLELMILKSITWLEKQGETFTKKDVDDAYLKGVSDTKNEFEKQGEKPQGKSALETWKIMRFEVYQQASGNRHEPNCSDDTTKMFSLNDIDEIFERIAETCEEQGEQKPVKWNEEDEKKLSDILAILRGGENCYYNSHILIDWLKFIKDRVQPQLQPKEWSEEDEKRLKSCLNILQPKTPLGNIETINTKWLKLLKDKYTWKPSDEQIEALAEALSLAKNCGEESAFVLRTLYEQLKKLKGE